MENENSVNYQAVLEDLIARRDKLNAAISALQEIAGITVEAGSVKSAGQAAAMTEIKSDSFFGLTIMDATKKYLAMVKKPVPAAQIAAALQEGGYLFSTDSPVNTVASVLNRNDAKGGEIVRVGKAVFGLAAWYPGRPKRKAKNGDREEGIETGAESSDSGDAEEGADASETP